MKLKPSKKKSKNKMPVRAIHLYDADMLTKDSRSKRKKYMMNTDGTVHFFNKGKKVSKYYKDGGIVITGRD